MRRFKLFVSMLLVFSMLFSIVPENTFAKNKKSNKKISILDGKMMGPDAKQVGKPKPLNFKIDYENYDLKFTDVSKDDPHYKAVVWAVENGVIKNEERELKLDEIMKVKEFFILLFELRWKYHQMEKERRSPIEIYKDFVGYELFHDKYILTTDMPEARAVLSLILWANPFIFTPTEIRHDADIFYKARYEPNKEVTKLMLYYVAGIGYWMYLFDFRKVPGKTTSSGWDYREELISKNAERFYNIAITNKKLKFSQKDFDRKNKLNHDLSDLDLDLIMHGIGYMQSWGLLKADPTFEELDLDKPISRGEMLEMLFRMCKYAKKNDNVDFRVKNRG